MTINYSQHYELTEILEKEPNLIPCPELYNFDISKLYAALMDRLAQPLPDGRESPFSSANPTSAHGVLMSVISYYQTLIGHELNLTPDRTWVQLFRMLGVELAPAEYPVILINFRKSQDAIERGITVKIPLGTEVKSNLSGISAYTSEYAEITGENIDINVMARLDRLGKIPSDLRIGEFNIIPRFLSYIDSAANDGTIIWEGREPETLPEAMLRCRQELQRGWRCDNPRSYFETALDAGASKVNILPGVQVGIDGKYGDIVTVVVYKPEIAPLVAQKMKDRIPLGTLVDVRGAEIIPVTGNITVRIAPYIVDEFNLAAIAISEKVNPPYGIWGDADFEYTTATALENIQGFLAVPFIELKRSDTGELLKDITIKPWQLLEIQNDIQFKWIRS